MLAVAVELHSDVVALPLGVQVARLDGAANAQVLQQADVVDAVFPADAGCAVRGAVVDDHVIQLVGAGFAVLPHPANDPLDVCLLIVGRDNQQHPDLFRLPHGNLSFGQRAPGRSPAPCIESR